MKQYTKLFLLFQVTFLIAIIINPTTSQAIGESWEVGTLYTFNFSDLEEITSINEKDNTELHTKSLDIGEFAFNITSINNVSQTYIMDMYEWDGSVTTIIGNDYDAEAFSNTELSLSSLFSVGYDWNYEFNTTVLASVTCNVDPWFFVEPNWTLINDYLASSINESEIVYALNDPFEPIIHNFTLSDVLNETISFAIMGVDTFPEINQQFVSNTTRWTFVYDFSNKVHFGVFNSTLGYNTYSPYETYKLTLEFEYSPGGILKEYFYSKEIKYTSLQITTTRLDEDRIAYGALPIPTDDSSVAYLLSIPAILVLAIVYKYQKKKK